VLKRKNICKFISEVTADKLEILCFVYESEHEIMTAETVEKSHRAILIKEGEGRIVTGGTSHSFSAGNLIFTFKGETVKMITQSCEYMYISFDGNRSEALFRRFGISEANRKFDGFESMIPLWHDSLSRASESNIDLTAEGMLLYVFSKLANTVSEQAGIINEVIQITEDAFSNPELSLSAVAEELNYNPKYISHLFKEKTGINYSEYLKNLRIKYAVALFDSGVNSVKNVAALSGFSDALYFSSVFKKTVGVSPKEYKETKNKKWRSYVKGRQQEFM